MREIEYYERPFDYKRILDIKKTATLNKSLREGMGSLKRVPASLYMLNFLPAQLYHFPLNSEEPVKTTTTVGKSSKKPINLETPIMTVSYTHLRAHETPEHLVCRLLLEKN